MWTLDWLVCLAKVCPWREGSSWGLGRAEGGPGLLSDTTVSLTASFAWGTGPDGGGSKHC